MKIAMITDTYRPRINGVVTSIDTYARELRDLGHAVMIVAPAFPGANHEPDVVRFPSHYLLFDPEDRVSNPWLPKSRRVARELSAMQFDVFHTHTPFTLGLAALGWARKKSIPLVHTYHTFFAKYVHWYLPFIPAGTGEKWTGSLSKWYCNRCDLVVTPSAAMRDVLTGYGVRSAIEVNPTGIYPAGPCRRGASLFRKGLGMDEKDRILLFMGRIAHEKNVEFLLGTVSLLRNEFPRLRLVLAGDGPARAWVARAAKRMGIAEHVRLVGYVTGEERTNCYRAADVFIFASETESQALVLSEAQSAGTPAVAVGALGVPESMGGKGPGDVPGGTLVRHNRVDFAAAVRRYLADAGYLAKKKQEALIASARWTARAAAERMLKLYARALEAAATRSDIAAREAGTGLQEK